MNGLLIIDKPQGITSHTVVQKVRRACDVKRVGHAGTLDPLATGLLLIGVGSCTRLIEYLVATDKGYRATFRLGRVTDSQDITGQVVSEHPTDQITAEQIREVCSHYIGEIEQVPPMFSALKQNGVPLYRLARQGIEVERQKRKITITRLDVESIDGIEVTIYVDCTKGTYIRTLCHDIGQELGCGACMTSLRRVRSGPFDESMALSLDSIIQGDFELLSPSAALSGFEAVQVAVSGRNRLREGIPPRIEDLSSAVDLQAQQQVVLMDGEKLMAIASYDPEHELESRGDFKLLKVFPSGI
ncbi:MAG: tRNA pseudouridine(55) synthase TruB [Deltaproteobacteria bacterium]|nr:tRNA pseudouridine(55) synthase TruB [Deltaproteobacteria bacterium]